MTTNIHRVYFWDRNQRLTILSYEDMEERPDTFRHRWLIPSKPELRPISEAESITGHFHFYREATHTWESSYSDMIKESTPSLIITTGDQRFYTGIPIPELRVGQFFQLENSTIIGICCVYPVYPGGEENNIKYVNISNGDSYLRWGTNEKIKQLLSQQPGAPFLPSARSRYKNIAVGQIYGYEGRKFLVSEIYEISNKTLFLLQYENGDTWVATTSKFASDCTLVFDPPNFDMLAEGQVWEAEGYPTIRIRIVPTNLKADRMIAYETSHPLGMDWTLKDECSYSVLTKYLIDHGYRNKLRVDEV